MSVRRLLIAAPAACLLIVTACGSDDDSGSDGGGELDCDAGLALSSTFSDLTASADAPTSDALESVLSDLDDWNPPSEISSQVDAVRDGLEVFIEQLTASVEDIDLEALESAGESLSTAGQEIDAYLAQNC